MGTIQIDGSTPKLTIGNAPAEDATIANSGTATGFGAVTALNNATANELVTVGSTTTWQELTTKLHPMMTN